MTETPTDSAPQPEQPEQPDQPPRQHQPGVDREHLRNYEQLRRSGADRKIAGVAGGLGRHLDIDPTIVRVLFVVLSLFGGAGLFLYGAAWLLVPEDGRDSAPIRTTANVRNALLIGAGVLTALGVLGNGWNQFWVPWPMILIGGGLVVWLLLREQGGAKAAPASGGQPVPDSSPAGPPPWATAQPQPAYPPPPPPRRRTKTGPKLFGVTLALVALALGGLGLADALGADVLDAAYPALALTVVGAMLVLGAFVGRAGGLTLLGVVAAVALAATSWGPGLGEGQDLSRTPVRAADVQDRYQVDAGQIRLDLSSVRDPEQLAGENIELDAQAGEILLILPDGVETEVAAVIDGPGAIELPDRSAGGFDTSLRGLYNQDDPGEVLTISARTNVGHIEVRTN